MTSPPTLSRNVAAKSIFTTVIFAGICLAALINEPPVAETEGQRFPWYSIVPPLFAVCFAILTGRILISLLLSVIIGGVLTTVPVAPTSLSAWLGGMGTGGRFVYGAAADPFNQQLLAFIILIMAMIGVMTVAGGLQGVVNWLERFAKGPRSTQFVTALMGLAIFIDDYANTMIVGSSMRPVSDDRRISREKLAFLVDATSAPIAGLAIISTWVGYEVSQFDLVSQDLNMGQGGYAILFDALPYRFYCMLMILFVFVNIGFGRDYGPMARAEKRTRETGAVADPDAVPMTSQAFTTTEPDASAAIKPRTAVIPIASLFVILLGGMWVNGGGMALMRDDALAPISPAAWRTVIGDSDSVMLLAVSSGIGLVLAWAMARFDAKLAFRPMGYGTLRGLQSSILPCVILILAWSLKSACDSLYTAEFLVAAVGDIMSPLWFPAIVFVLAGMVSFATGTSYGTMAILIPTATPIALQLDGGVYSVVTIITLAAILDGAIFGDHCSPISDTTIMCSISSACDHLHHVRTQLPYSLTVASLALIAGYIPAASGMAPWLTLLISLAAIVTLFAALRWWDVGYADNVQPEVDEG